MIYYINKNTDKYRRLLRLLSKLAWIRTAPNTRFLIDWQYLNQVARNIENCLSRIIP